MTGDPIRLSRAHRRFLGLALPPQISAADDEFRPLHQVLFQRSTHDMLRQHLQTAGPLRSGLILGYREAGAPGVAQVCAVLSGGYGQRDPLIPDAQYALGAVEAVSQLTTPPCEWLGTWVMPADGLAPSNEWDERIWHAARRRALISPDTVLVTFGQTPERLEVHAYTEDDGQPSPLAVVWQQPSGGEG